MQVCRIPDYTHMRLKDSVGSFQSGKAKLHVYESNWYKFTKKLALAAIIKITICNQSERLLWSGFLFSNKQFN